MNEDHVYEVGVFVGDEHPVSSRTYEIDHRFPGLPDVETLKALKDEAVEAVEAFLTLHPDVGIEVVNVRCNYLEADERGDSGSEPDREPADA